MKKTISITVITILSAFGFLSCDKNGCTDVDATNYVVDANSDDGTCTYSGDIAFWCLPEVSTALKDAGHVNLYFELEGEIVDSIVTELFFAASGVCGASGVKTINRVFTGDSKHYYKYRVKGKDYVTLYEDFILLDANSCLGIRLE
jgi:hypothetical protein